MASASANSDARSETSHTAQDYIASQLSLEADAREALPYQFDTCTKPLGALRQSVYACLTCTPPPASPHQQFSPAGVCYSCSISCHGEHTLVEIFSKRDFVCDCGTSRLATSGTPCELRVNSTTGRKGGVTGEEARTGNKYNHNFEGKFCACGEEYDPEKEKGTMFQCLGLGHVENGGCGEDWWHPECLMGIPRKEHGHKEAIRGNGSLETVKEEGDEPEQPAIDGAQNATSAHEDEAPHGFPHEDDFDHLICYKCANAFPWIKQYAGTTGFLPALAADQTSNRPIESFEAGGDLGNKKRKAEDEDEDSQASSKKVKPDEDLSPAVVLDASHATIQPKHKALPRASHGAISIFVKEDFRDHLCRCSECFPHLSKLPQLLEEEETYEPPVSESDHNENGSVAGRSVNSGSLLDRGEAALSSMDRVRAIEGVMAYNMVRDKVKAFLQPFAESGQAVGAEDIKEYFAKLRGDDQAQREAAVGAENGAVQGDGRKEQDGY